MGRKVKKEWIKLGFSTQDSGRFSIGISKLYGLNGNQSVFLRDLNKNVYYDLRKSDYEFDVYQPGGLSGSI